MTPQSRNEPLKHLFAQGSLHCSSPPHRFHSLPRPRRRPASHNHSIAAGSRSHPNPARAGGRVVYGTKCIRSHYLPSLTGTPPDLSATTPPKGRASPYTIDAATMHLCGVDHSASHNHSVAAGSRSHRARNGLQNFFNNLLSEQNSKVIELAGQIDNSDNSTISHRSTR